MVLGSDRRSELNRRQNWCFRSAILISNPNPIHYPSRSEPNNFSINSLPSFSGRRSEPIIIQLQVWLIMCRKCQQISNLSQTSSKCTKTRFWPELPSKSLRTPLEKLTTLLRPPSRLGRGYTLSPYPPPGRLWRLDLGASILGPFKQNQERQLWA